MNITLSKYSRIVGLLALLPGIALAEPLFTSIDLPPNSNDSTAYSLSADGSTIVGDAQFQDPLAGVNTMRAIKWTEANGTSTLPCPTNRDYEWSWGHASSADGSVVVGVCEDTYDFVSLTYSFDLVLWDATGLPTIIMDGENQKSIGGISDDGQTVVGFELNAMSGAVSSWRWDSGTGLTRNYLIDAHPFDISSDGTVIVGIDWSTAEGGIFRLDNGVKTLISLPTASPDYWLYDVLVSGDGSVIFAMLEETGVQKTLRWTQINGWEVINSDTSQVAITDASFDGTIASGYMYNPVTQAQYAIVWDTTNGVRLMHDVIHSWGLATSGWSLGLATGISDDGTMFSGSGIHTANNLSRWEGWYARLSGTPLPPLNKPPVAYEDNYTALEDSPLIMSAATGVLSNDVDADGDSLTASLVSGTSNGTLSLQADGSFSYTPNSNFAGSDSFTYIANDGLDDSAPAMVTIIVAPVNDAPIACFVFSEPVYQRKEVIFDANCSYDIDGTLVSEYHWAFGDGTEGVSINTTTFPITYKRAGDYIVTLTVTDDEGAMSSVSQTVTVVKGGGKGGKPK